MTDEQNIVIASLKDQALDKEVLDNGDGDIFAYDACNLRKAANMIVELEETNAYLRKENERIRQTSVTHEVYKMALDELETYKQSQHDLFMALCQTKRERNAAVFDIGNCVQYTSMCCVCKYESKKCFENPCRECRKNNFKFDWRGPCAENGGKDNDNERTSGDLRRTNQSDGGRNGGH